ncbi:MAG: hypothetical protein AB1646_11300 [Thermodesulfobacteriota bacterium]
MLEGNKILVIGARAGGYGASIAEAAVAGGAEVYGTTLNPEDVREQEFFEGIGVKLLDVPLKFDVERRAAALDALNAIEQRLRDHGVERLDAVIHTVAGGFPRQPSVMKAVSDILKGVATFSDMATAVKRNVYYVNATSFEDMVNGLAGISHEGTRFVALTYRGELPYFISPTKSHLERLAARLARSGKNTLIAALPEAWTQSSQFFAGIEIAVLHNYVKELQGHHTVANELAPAFSRMERALGELQGLDNLVIALKPFLEGKWAELGSSSDPGEFSGLVESLYKHLRSEGTFPALRRSVEIISDFVREASGIILVRDFLAGNKHQPGDVRQVRFRDLVGDTEIGLAAPREHTPTVSPVGSRWISYGKDEVRKTLDMYGEGFLFLDTVTMEAGPFHDGFRGFGTFVVPGPDQSPILRDHFVNLPLFGGHLQMEAVAQFGTFMILKLLQGKKLVPILTGTEFPDLNTMAPPGEKLTIMGIIRMPEKRRLTLEAFIENRFARSKGFIRGMLLNERLMRKMMASFQNPDAEDFA